MASLIETHNALPLAHLAPLLPPTLLRTQLYTSASIPPRLFTECFNLVRDNMMEMYKRTVGWKAGDKRKEMKHPAMRYLLALGDSNGVADGNEWEDEDDEGACSVLAYVSFMVTEEEGDEVVYWCVLDPFISREEGGGWGLTDGACVATRCTFPSTSRGRA